MQKLGNGAINYVKRILGEKAFEEYDAMKKWPDIVGENIAEHTKAIRVRYGKLTIHVDDPVWRNELLLMKPMILQRYESLCHNKIIRDIIFL
jgi:predicted nucleic acid-binding Zn ribbon protein